MKHRFYVISALLGVGIGLSSPSFAEGASVAQARLIDSTGNRIGIATFVEHKKGAQITLNVKGLTPGAHGMHIHNVGECDTTTKFLSAGPHFNPHGTLHGAHSSTGPHAGDLPNLIVKENGKVAESMENSLITLEEGLINSSIDADGSALIIHAGPDDLISDPTGKSGGRIACGVIEKLN